MRFEMELYLKFPSILRDKFINGEIDFPETTKIKYKSLLTYRAVEREEYDFHPIDSNDFKSYYELNKRPKNARGVNRDLLKDAHYYGVSSFLNRKIVEQKMNFPNPNKKMAEGYVYMEGGPQDTNEQHVCWWLYEDADVTGFKLLEGNNE
jgi:hypothetical protein